MSAQDPKAQYGFAMILNHEDDHRRIGQHGSLIGYSGSLYDFPEDQLTIVVLTNTEGQNAYAITRSLARAILGLPALPDPARHRSRSLPISRIRRRDRRACRHICAETWSSLSKICTIPSRNIAGPIAYSTKTAVS